MTENTFPHQSVMQNAVLEVLNPGPGKIFLDGTLGAGGHTEAILHATAPDGKVIAFDLDPEAIKIAEKRLAPFGNRILIIQDSYASLSAHLKNEDKFDGFLLDLGVSSMQIDNAERGFSFMREGPLDMRFGPKQLTSAYDIVNGYPEEELARILWIYGEERKSRQIAARICSERKKKPVQTTTELAGIIVSAGKGYREKIHPATRSFQAIRIAVNGELDALETVLPVAVDHLKIGGRLAVISFHSLEDRIVKHFMQAESRNCICPPHQPVCTCGHIARLKIVAHHALTADDAEIDANTRARSAKLRVAERIGEFR
ncbi:MAG: 16S rRNA (cytosine(1402)-N(4))-methyltransferase RsmH [Flexilinea sp.]